MAPRVTPAEFAEKWARRTSGATADYTKGIDRVSVAPGQLAAAKEDKLVAGFQAAIQSGKWRERVAGVSLTEWKTKAKEKGAGRIASGVAGASADMQKFGQELLAFEDSVQAEINAMPDLNLEDRIARSVAWQRRMATFRRS